MGNPGKDEDNSMIDIKIPLEDNNAEKPLAQLIREVAEELNKQCSSFEQGIIRLEKYKQDQDSIILIYDVGKGNILSPGQNQTKSPYKDFNYI